MKTYTNRFSVLSHNDSDEDFTFKFPSKITHLEPHPIAKLIKFPSKITHLEPHPIAKLIKYICICDFILYKNKVRFNDRWNFTNNHKNASFYIKRRYDQYNDHILLQSELDRLKREYELSKETIQKMKDEVFENIWELNDKIYKIKNDCNTTCVKWLSQIHICSCKKCYNCENTDGIDRSDLGRCVHYYHIQDLEQNIYDEQDSFHDDELAFFDIESRYERELAKKNKKLDEYERKIDEDFDDWSFQEYMEISYYQRNYKEPVYIY